MIRQMLGKESPDMSRPIQYEDEKPNSTPVDPFKYKDESISMKNFVDTYGAHLPVVVRVTEGFCSPDEGKFTFSVEDAYWVTHIKKTKRVLGRISDDLFVSIPVEHKMEFYVVETDRSKYGPTTLENMLLLHGTDMLTSRVDIVPARKKEVTVWQGAETQDIMVLQKMEIFDSYNETYAVGNPILQKALHDYRCAIPVFVPIKLQTSCDLVRPTFEKKYKSEINRLKEFTKLFPNDQAKGNLEIMIFTGDQIDAYGGAYEYIDPYEVVKNVQRSTSKDGRYASVNPGPTLPPPHAAPPPLCARKSQSFSIKKAPAPDPAYSNQGGDVGKKNAQKVKSRITSSFPKAQHDKARQDQPSFSAITTCSNLNSNPTPSQKSVKGKRLPKEGEIVQARESTNEYVREPYEDVESWHPELVSGKWDTKKPRPIPTDSNLSPEELERIRITKENEVEKEDSIYYIGNDAVYAELAHVPKIVDFNIVTKHEVGKFLRLLKLHKYIEPFDKQDVDGSLLKDLTTATLKEDFGMSGLEATKLMKFVKDGWRPH